MPADCLTFGLLAVLLSLLHQGEEFGAGDGNFTTRQQSEATASGRMVSCGVNFAFRKLPYQIGLGPIRIANAQLA